MEAGRFRGFGAEIQEGLTYGTSAVHSCNLSRCGNHRVLLYDSLSGDQRLRHSDGGAVVCGDALDAADLHGSRALAGCGAGQGDGDGAEGGEDPEGVQRGRAVHDAERLLPGAGLQAGLRAALGVLDPGADTVLSGRVRVPVQPACAEGVPVLGTGGPWLAGQAAAGRERAGERAAGGDDGGELRGRVRSCCMAVRRGCWCTGR